MSMEEIWQYYAILAYHKSREDSTSAINHWDTYLAHLKDSGENYWECLALLEYIRLLKQDNRLIEQTVSQYRLIASKMKSQKEMLEKLDATLIT